MLSPLHSRLNPLLSRLAQLRLEAVVATVAGAIEEAHVVVLHVPVHVDHGPVLWQPGVDLVDEAFPCRELAHQSDRGVVGVVGHRVRMR